MAVMCYEKTLSFVMALCLVLMLICAVLAYGARQVVLENVRLRSELIDADQRTDCVVAELRIVKAQLWDLEEKVDK